LDLHVVGDDEGGAGPDDLAGDAHSLNGMRLGDRGPGDIEAVGLVALVLARSQKGEEVPGGHDGLDLGDELLGLVAGSGHHEDLFVSWVSYEAPEHVGRRDVGLTDAPE